MKMNLLFIIYDIPFRWQIKMATFGCFIGFHFRMTDLKRNLNDYKEKSMIQMFFYSISSNQ